MVLESLCCFLVFSDLAKRAITTLVSVLYPHSPRTCKDLPTLHQLVLGSLVLS